MASIDEYGSVQTIGGPGGTNFDSEVLNVTWEGKSDGWHLNGGKDAYPYPFDAQGRQINPATGKLLSGASPTPFPKSGSPGGIPFATAKPVTPIPTPPVAGVLPASTTVPAAGTLPAGATPGVFSPAMAPAVASPSFLDKILGNPYTIPVAGSLVGTYMQSRAASEAAKLGAADSAEQRKLLAEMARLDLEEARRKEDLQRADSRQQQEIQRGDWAPYGSIGRGALAGLSQGLGFNLSDYPIPNLPEPIVSPPTNYGSLAGMSGNQTAVPRQPPTTPAQTTMPTPAVPTQTAGTVPIRSPQGTVYQVPEAKVAEAVARGGVRM